MGHKANPKGLRLGIVRDWDATWFATNEYKKKILQDYKIRNFLSKELSRAGVSKIHINRKGDEAEALVSVARPGIVLGKAGMDIALMAQALQKLVEEKIKITIVEEKNVELVASLIGEWVTQQIEKRMPFRRVMKMAVQKTLKAGALGVKIACSGRLGGLEIARTEWYREGKVPLHTLRADIDYAFVEALTTYGKIGVKVWVYNGDIINTAATTDKATPVLENAN